MPTTTDGPDPQRLLADTIQALYLARGRSLADPATAQAHDIALEAAALVMQSACATGELTTEAFATAAVLLDDARRAPEFYGANPPRAGNAR